MLSKMICSKQWWTPLLQNLAVSFFEGSPLSPIGASLHLMTGK
jgi:hypothetical protein